MIRPLPCSKQASEVTLLSFKTDSSSRKAREAEIELRLLLLLLPRIIHQRPQNDTLCKAMHMPFKASSRSQTGSLLLWFNERQSILLVRVVSKLS